MRQQQHDPDVTTGQAVDTDDVVVDGGDGGGIAAAAAAVVSIKCKACSM